MNSNCVVRATVVEDVHERLKRMALEYGGSVSSVVREAIELGLEIMEVEERKYANLNESNYVNIRNKVMRARVS